MKNTSNSNLAIPAEEGLVPRKRGGRTSPAATQHSNRAEQRTASSWGDWTVYGLKSLMNAFLSAQEAVLNVMLGISFPFLGRIRISFPKFNAVPPQSPPPLSPHPHAMRTATVSRGISDRAFVMFIGAFQGLASTMRSGMNRMFS